MDLVNLMCRPLDLLDHERYVKSFIINIVVSRALVFFSTVASVLRCGVVVDKDILVVVNDTIRVRQAAVAYFHVVLALVV